MQIQNSIDWNFNWLIGLLLRAQNRDATNLLFVQQFNFDVAIENLRAFLLQKNLSFHQRHLLPVHHFLETQNFVVHFSIDEMG